jgi:hypothetical protein
MTDSKRLAANRLNATKSTGPTTAAGKARSKMNALKHGLTAKSVIVAGENRDDFTEFAEVFMKELQPQTPIEHEMALEIIMAAWRRRRCYRIESKLFAQEAFDDGLDIDENGPGDAGLAFLRLGSNGVITNLLRYEGAQRIIFYRAMKVLEQIRKRKSKK